MLKVRSFCSTWLKRWGLKSFLDKVNHAENRTLGFQFEADYNNTATGASLCVHSDGVCGPVRADCRAQRPSSRRMTEEEGGAEKKKKRSRRRMSS